MDVASRLQAGALLPGQQGQAGTLAADPSTGQAAGGSAAASGKARRAPEVTVVDPGAGAVLASKVAAGVKRGADQVRQRAGLTVVAD